jgi:hypothetical protein
MVYDQEQEMKNLLDGVHAAVSFTYIEGERARLQARVALKQGAGWPLTDGELERLAELDQETRGRPLFGNQIRFAYNTIKRGINGR